MAGGSRGRGDRQVEGACRQGRTGERHEGRKIDMRESGGLESFPLLLLSPLTPQSHHASPSILGSPLSPTSHLLTHILFSMVSDQLPQFKIPSNHCHLEGEGTGRWGGPGSRGRGREAR